MRFPIRTSGSDDAAARIFKNSHHAAIAGMIGKAVVVFRAESEVFFPIDQMHGDGERTFHTEADDVGIELREGHIVFTNSGSVDVHLEIIIGKNKSRNQFSICINGDDIAAG